MSENTMSKSKAKRKARLEESKKAKREAKRGTFIANFVIILIVAIFAVAVGALIYTKVTTTTASSDYGAFLNEDGTLRDVNPTDYVEALDYKNIVVPAAEVEYTEEEMQAAIDSALSSHKELNSDAALTVADGDTVNIDYVGTVDGVEFEGGNTGGSGADLTIGSGSYVDTFEQQLIGSHPGDQVLVTVTFPEDYSSEDLQGKEAEFDVTVNGIYETPEFSDEFVATNLSDKAATMEEYRNYLKETNEATKLDTYLSTYISDNATSKAANEGHIKYLKGIGKYDQETYYNSYNETYVMMTGSPAFNSFSEFTGMSNSEFEAYLQEEAEKRSTLDMTYQYIFTDAGLSISEEDYQAKVESIGSESAQTYGKGYVMQMLMQDKVLAYLAENVTVE
ncbi:MAG: FKBP-type peptidyl-prolyl cis-trans isomerase [Lachnospiraceae bacterium]|nr:FKBP-type peptidyl-prolyl cis-trans isomerase [Lachnospiraceae bacterium]